jgi:predicted MFS family arabinose efflux permease
LTETPTPSRTEAGISQVGPSRLALQLGAATLFRLILNTSRRFAYPFASALSRGLGVPLTAITSMIALNQITGLISPIFGPLGDRWGFRIIMLAGMSLLTVGMLVGGLLPIYVVILIGLLLAGLGKSIYDPALQAYVGEKVPYHRRGLAIGAIEFAWAGSSLVGIPLVGLLIARLGWRSPFFALGGFGLLGIIGLAILIPPDNRRQESNPERINFKEAWGQLSKERAVLGALGFGFLVCAANDNLFVVYGAWLESSFGLTVVALGAATTVIGVAELLGEILTAAIADRLGLKRAIFAGLALSAGSYILLPTIARTLPLALAGLFLVFLTFEFTIVTSFSLFTEVLPTARGTMMSSNVALISLGRMVGTMIGAPVWLAGGLMATGLTSAVISGVALLWLMWGLRNWQS